MPLISNLSTATLLSSIDRAALELFPDLLAVRSYIVDVDAASGMPTKVKAMIDGTVSEFPGRAGLAGETAMNGQPIEITNPYNHECGFTSEGDMIRARYTLGAAVVP